MKRTGFTLIELLVVIAIIALLVALTTTVLRTSRTRAKAVLCASNIRQLSLGLFMYAGENETFPYGYRVAFPGSGEYLGDAAMDMLGLWWLDYIEDFTEKPNSKEGLFCCPSKNLSGRNLQRNILWGNYGVNRSICRTFPPSRLEKREFTGTPLGSENILRPSQTLLIVDSGYSLVNWWYVTDVPPVSLGGYSEDFGYVPGIGIGKGRRLLPGQLWDAVVGRHPNRTVNVGFADGHASPTNAQDLFVENIAETYQNKTPLWVPK